MVFLIVMVLFIPGFEDNVVGMKKGQSKEFTVPFPKDYGVKALQGKKVTFNVTVPANEVIVSNIKKTVKNRLIVFIVLNICLIKKEDFKIKRE